tara:strand:+ start:261 stop:590 length:330 start_codon:yes stop_codon:yes gene_type:complete
MALCLFLFTSCWSTEYLKTDDSSKNYPRSNPEDIKVYATDDTGREYEILGVVNASVDAGNVGDIAVDHLIFEASKLGADAVLNLRLEIGYGFWQSSVKATGIAVKFVND